MDEREFKIIIQNLLNRAVEVELHNAKLRGQDFDFSKCEEDLTRFKGIFKNQLDIFKKVQK
jgi:hypothetical protein